MARRRGIEGAQNTIDMLMQHLLRQSQLQEISKVRADQDLTDFTQGLIPSIRGGQINPREDLSPRAFARLQDFVDPDILSPSQEERAAGVIGTFQGKSGGDLPTDMGSEELLRLAGVDLDPSFGRMGRMEGGPDTLPSTQMGPVTNPNLARTRGALGEAREQARKFEPTVELPFFSDQDNRMHRQVVPQSEAASFGALPQGPTPQRAGEMQVEQFKAGEGSPGMVAAKADADNSFRDLTAKSRYRDAFSIGMSQASGQQTGFLQPPLVDARVEEHNRKAGGTASAQASVLTQAELTAAGQIIPLVQADAMMRELEDLGFRLRPFAVTAVTSPLVGKMAQSIDYFSPEDIEYTQTALDYTNNVSKIFSGVAVRPDERDNFLAVMTAMPTDDQTVILTKQRRRATFNAAAQVKVGRGSTVAGEALANAIKGFGLTDEELVGFVNSLEFTDPKIKAAFDATIGEP